MIGLGCLISLNTQQPYLVAYAPCLSSACGFQASQFICKLDGRTTDEREPDDGRTFAKTRKAQSHKETRTVPTTYDVPRYMY